MEDRFKFEADYWRAFALLAVARKRTIDDFWAELHRCSAGQFPSNQDVESILDEFYAESGRAACSIRHCNPAELTKGGAHLMSGCKRRAHEVGDGAFSI